VVSNQTLLPELPIKRGSIRNLAIKIIKLFTDAELVFPPYKKTTNLVEVFGKALLNTVFGEYSK